MRNKKLVLRANNTPSIGKQANNKESKIFLKIQILFDIDIIFLKNTFKK